MAYHTERLTLINLYIFLHWHGSGTLSLTPDTLKGYKLHIKLNLSQKKVVYYSACLDLHEIHYYCEVFIFAFYCYL